MKKTIYYSDELNDEFSEATITPRFIGDDYKYDGSFFRPVGRLVWYHILAKPLAKVYLKLGFGHKIVNKEVLKQAKRQGYFLYGNHTNAGPDALIPTMVNMGRSVFVIVHPNNVSMPVFRHITPSLGALPLPDSRGALKNFMCSIEGKMKHNKIVMIYPEAHIWPYYTKIRPFKADSFRYPVQYNVPVYCITNTYQEWKHHKKPRIVTYVDGPFYVDMKLPRKEQKQALRDAVYDTMVKRSKNSTVEHIIYRKK